MRERGQERERAHGCRRKEPGRDRKTCENYIATRDLAAGGVSLGKEEVCEGVREEVGRSDVRFFRCLAYLFLSLNNSITDSTVLLAFMHWHPL